ncbi:oleate hydratase [Streptococcus gallinaceus]|uniref:Oleate hydratase n=1 Tax=Streptococcus gallinaceus TaxID=165758 RepID=A0ABV2JLG0_9STRE|nr:oleate hydratase [Streptococcus gallinaceus]MCP1639626.1 oleate hydratase [Streptococcus gallinaceus]MCP1770409.1 oleate hydratase [Streptococcus gallinaceus]
MYYSNGNYEAFARPLKPERVDEKQAYIVGAGLGALATAAFLVRDGQMKGEHIHVLEMAEIPGGACDGIEDSQKGFIIRGGREMENHFECLWDLFRSIPSLEVEDASVLDEFYWLNKRDPNYSLCRATVNQGQDAHTDGKFTLSDKASQELVKLFLTSDKELEDKTIDDVFSEDFYASNFWLYWQTMFAFETWHSAIEMKRYLHRFVHHIGGLPDFSALKFTKYNQYESLILPLISYLEAHNVHFQYQTQVTNVHFERRNGKQVAVGMDWIREGQEEHIELTSDDLVFVTNGSCVEEASLGDHEHAPQAKVANGEGASWQLWRKIAGQDRAFGRPEKFCTNIAQTNWESATATVRGDVIPKYIEAVCKRDPFSGKVVTGGIVTAKDSSWLMSYTLNRQPHFKNQSKDQLVVWIYGLYTDRLGDYVKKPMKNCSGYDITREWLYHLGVPKNQIDTLAKEDVTCIPCMMPYITAFFMPRAVGDRPKVVPDDCINFAFIGQFVEVERDCVFTTETSVRTAMEAVYTLLDIDRGVPEVFNSVYDIRCLLDATAKMMDGKTLRDMNLPWFAKVAEKGLSKKLKGTVVEELLERYHLL